MTFIYYLFIFGLSTSQKVVHTYTPSTSEKLLEATLSSITRPCLKKQTKPSFLVNVVLLFPHFSLSKSSGH
jgi:hypothetical protein